MHPGLCAASSVIAAPSSPDGSTAALRCAQDLVACSGTSGGNGIVALAGVEGTVGGDAGDVLTGRDLVEEIGPHRGIADIAGGELRRPDFQRFLGDSDAYSAPDAAFGAAVLAGVPFAFALDLDPGAVDQTAQWPV